MAKSLTKEKEKLCRVEEIFQSLIEVKEEVSKKIEKLPPQFNLLENIRNKNSNNSLQRFETYNSDLLHYILNIKRENINFTKLFLEYLQNEKKLKFDFDLNKINYKNIKVDKEYYTTVKIEEEGIEKNGRIDILIYGSINNKETKKSFAIIIENKINADDQDTQLERYYKYISKIKGYGNNVYVIYLTPIIKPPREYSFSEKYIKKVGEKFQNITHGDIGRWLENILKNKEYNFLHKNNFRLLKSALIQIIDNEKSISGENEEKNMEEKEIKRVLNENLFKYIETVEKADEYIGMFNKVSELIKEQKKLIIKKEVLPYFKFANEVVEELEKQSYKKGDAPDKDTYCICDDNHVIEHGCHWLGLGNVFLQADWDYEKSSAKYHFGICVEENDIEMKRKIKKLKTEIKNIFYYFEYHENNNDWIFDYNQNIENENPKKIAEVMIKLNELLKKEIK